MTNKPANDNNPRPAWFDKMLMDYDGYIRAKICRLECNKQNREDIYQRVMLKAIERWASFRRDGNFCGWLFLIVRESVNRHVSTERLEIGARVAEPTQEHATDLSRALEMASDEVVAMATGYSNAEIAAVYGVTSSAIHYRIKSARAKMAANDNQKVSKSA